MIANEFGDPDFFSSNVFLWMGHRFFVMYFLGFCFEYMNSRLGYTSPAISSYTTRGHDIIVKYRYFYMISRFIFNNYSYVYNKYFFKICSIIAKTLYSHVAHFIVMLLFYVEM